MSIFNYVQSLIPITKGRVLEDISKLREELRDYNEENYVSAAEHFKKFSLKNRVTKGFNDDYQRIYRKAGRTSYIAGVNNVTKNSIAVLDVLDDLVDEKYGNSITGSGLTYLKANVLRHIEAVGFFAKYSRALLLYTYAAETSERTKEGKNTTGDFLSKPEREWLFANFRDFCHVLNTLSKDPKWVKETYATLPDVVVDKESEETLRETIGDGKLNPVFLNFVAPRWWPIYHTRIAWAEWQVLRRDKAVEERKAIQFRLLHLKATEEGHRDAKVENEILYLEDRISKLSRKIDKLEK